MCYLNYFYKDNYDNNIVIYVVIYICEGIDFLGWGFLNNLKEVY